jgi:hypothetical protein
MSPEQWRLIKRAPLPSKAVMLMTSMDARIRKMRVNPSLAKPPCGTLWAALDSLETDWSAVKKIAASLSDPKYSLEKFYDDIGSFPELHLYLLEQSQAKAGSAVEVCHVSSNSGRTIGDEYQRTLGAFFAVYWLARLHVDGKNGFCFGVDNNWKPIDPTSPESANLLLPEKRAIFHREGNWTHFRRLLLDAELIKEDKKGKVTIVEKRMAALLALTAIHDIMKIAEVLPTVQAAHSPYQGYKTDDRIGDHDHALGYIMEHYPEMLPSYRALGKDEKRAVLFTQANLSFNHGWFVQAEAPPGVMLSSFKKVIEKEKKTKLGRKDIALYFVHWLTDLAGAETTPLGGCEKFVIRFPLAVLNSFLRSFEFLQMIADNTETVVNEEYLKMRWNEHTPWPGPIPTGEDSIAKMRLLCMAQMNAEAFVRDFDELREDDRETLAVEMSRTGCEGQHYSADLVPAEVRDQPVGPTFLVYYGPAFVQNLGSDSPVRKLSVLAEIYRCARELWPASPESVTKNVIIRVDTIKGLSTTDLITAKEEGSVWLLVKHNDTEAFVEKSTVKKMNKRMATTPGMQIIDLSNMLTYVV